MIDWMESGNKYNKSAQQKAKLQKIFASIVWKEFVLGKQEALMPAMAIKEIIKQTNRKPLRYAISRELAPLGLYGIEFNYTDATVKTYWVDDGVSLCSIGAEPTYKEGDDA